MGVGDRGGDCGGDRVMLVEVDTDVPDRGTLRTLRTTDCRPADAGWFCAWTSNCFLRCILTSRSLWITEGSASDGADDVFIVGVFVIAGVVVGAADDGAVAVVAFLGTHRTLRTHIMPEDVGVLRVVIVPP